MPSSSSSEERNFEDFSPSESSSSLDKKSSRALEFMLRDHDDDSRLKKLGDPLAPVSKPMSALSEGSNRKEKGVAHPWSMKDLCQSWPKRLMSPTWLGR
ncbi:hypothetical protein BHM03_00056739 [Ensete ventricosum]|nr:hypothetical protein BHM03_00056739 [Ensete ventricosum]